MSRAARIRDWLEKNASEQQPKSMAEIGAALELPAQQLHSTMGDLYRAGFIESKGEKRHRGYWRADKTPAPKAPLGLTAAERAERERERMRLRRRRNGSVSWEERRAIRAAAAAERERNKADRLAQREAARAAREAEKEAKRTARAEAKAAREAARKARRVEYDRTRRASTKPRRATVATPRKPQKPVAPKPGTLNAAPQQAPAMTSDDFERMGGKVERIAPGVVSEAGRLKHVGGWRQVFTEPSKRRELSA